MPALVRAAFPNIIIPGRHGIQRPRWPFRLNKDSPQAEGLIHWWPMMPAQASTAFDLAVIGAQDGSIGGFVTDTSHVEMGPGLNFPGGVGDRITCGDPTDVDFEGNDFALVVWLLVNTEDERQIPLAKDSSGGSARQFALQYDDNDSTINKLSVFYVDDADTIINQVTDGNDVLSLNVPHHWIGQRRGNNLDIYLDGVELASSLQVGAHADMRTTSTNITLGGRPFTNFTEELKGELYDCRIYDRSFSAAEAWQMANEKRWDVYYELGRVFYSIPAAAAVGNPWHVYAQQ